MVLDEEEFIRFAERELAFVKNYIKDAPRSLFIAFRKEFEGLEPSKVREVQKNLYDMYLNNADRNHLALDIAYHGEAEIILKPASYKVEPDKTVIITTRGGSKLIGECSMFGENTKQVINNLSDWMYVIVRYDRSIEEEFGKNSYLIVEADTLHGKVDTDKAKEILNEYNLTPAEIIISGFGVKPDKVIHRLFLPRLLSMFYYLDNPLHVLQFTNVETGKTEFGTRLEFMMSYTFYSEFPSVAELIYDGRTGNVGSVFTSSGIVIDELDKVSKHRFVEAYQPLNTGLENGIWRRGVSISGRRLEVYRRLPFLFFGNCTQGNDSLYDRLFDNQRQTAIQILNNALRQTDDDYTININSLFERIAICDVFPKYVPVSDYVILNEHHAVGVLPDPVMRGIIQIVQESIKDEYVEPDDECKGRMRRHAEAVYNVIYALTLNEYLDVEDVKSVVLGNKDFDYLLPPENGEKIVNKDGSVVVVGSEGKEHEDNIDDELLQNSVGMEDIPDYLY